ncbi:MAG: hypothetical protein M3R38_16700 [Actinomycetota bacterium]|nr:hypothetical protein [Actinomycetota bacterium]
MSSPTLFRLSGLALLLGAILAIVAIVGHNAVRQASEFADITNSPSVTFVRLLMVGALLVIIGLPGLYARQAERAGVLGLLGFVMTFVGLLFADVVMTANYGFIMPKIAATSEGRALIESGLPDPGFMMLVFPMILIGLLLLGIGIVRAKVLPRWMGLLFVAGVLFIPVASAVPLIAHLFSAPIFLAFASCGYALVRDTPQVAWRHEPAQQVS